MPWTADDAEGHTSHADTPEKRKQWAAVANSAKSGGKSDAVAIREANAAVHKNEIADEIARNVIAHLQKHAPEVVDVLREDEARKRTGRTLKTVLFGPDGDDTDSLLQLAKDITAGDVHVAGDMNRKKSKSKNFKQALTDGDGKRQPKVQEDDGTGGAVGKDAEWELPFKILKAEPSQRLIFGWASIATKDGQIVVDKQKDMILPEDLEKAAYDFVLYCRTQGDMHKQGQDGVMPVGRLVESMMFTKEKQDVLKIDLGCEGWWVGFYVDNDDVWAAHKRGERPEFSIGGRGRRVAI